MVLQKCVYIPALDPLLKDAPEKILKYVVAQYAKVLPNDHDARKKFVSSKGLARVLELKSDDKVTSSYIILYYHVYVYV